jgi:hypothetical protein
MHIVFEVIEEDKNEQIIHRPLSVSGYIQYSNIQCIIYLSVPLLPRLLIVAL